MILRFIYIIMLLTFAYLGKGVAQGMPSDRNQKITSQVTELSVYPNPAFDAFSVTNDQSVTSIAIYSIIGKEVDRFNHRPDEQHDIADLPNGLYIVRLFDSREEIVKVLRLNKK